VERRRELTRTIGRRLERLEVTRAQQIAAARPEPHTLCFIDMDKRVVSAFEMGTSKWTHFDPPRDRAAKWIPLAVASYFPAQNSLRP
jgi:hypothetical protein